MTASIQDHFFASATRDEVWRVTRAGSTREEKRTEAGHASLRRRTDGSLAVTVTDDFSLAAPAFPTSRSLSEIHGELTTIFPGDSSVRHAHVKLPRDDERSLVIRHVTVRRFSASAAGEAWHQSEVFTASCEGRGSVAVRTIEEVIDRLIIPTRSETPRPVDHRELPIFWTRGSGSVLMHEAAGHAAEARAKPAAWPSWLTVIDDPHATGLGQQQVDDCGNAGEARDLLGGQSPSCLRRPSFRDIPASRLSNLSVSSTGGPFELPAKFIEVSLIDGGNYDELTDRVTLAVGASELVDRGERHPLEPFILSETRAAIASSLIGGYGELVTYPGVICSRDGHRVPVGSASIDLLTGPFVGR